MIILIFFFIITYNSVQSQEFPQEFFEYHLQKYEYDIGNQWEYNSTLEPFSFKQYNPDNLGDSSSIHFIIGTFPSFKNNDFNNAIYFWGRTQFNKNLYIYLYPRIVSDPNSYDRFSGIPRPQKRYGFNSGESDLAGLVYENQHLSFQIGRGRQIWGAGNNLQIGLGEKTPPYDFGLLKLYLKNFQYRIFNGFLENKNDVNRYITGRAIEWSNKKSVVLSLSEIAVYSGLNRPLDLAYLNPISTHLEIELNDKQNQLGTDSGNAIWQFSYDFLLKNDFRFSGNFLIDELVIDEIEKDLGKTNGLAWSMGLHWAPIKTNKYIFSASGSWIHIGTHTFRHESGYNNFIHRNMPLGWEGGSDSEEITASLNLFRPNDFLFSLSFGKIVYGENTILLRSYEPYKNYNSGPFPSGEIVKNAFLSVNTFYKLSERLRVNFQLEHIFNDREDSYFYIIFNYNFFRKIIF